MVLTDAEMHARMVNGWRGGLRDGTVCGYSSTRENTKAVRQWLPELCERYDVRTVCDAGAGDLHWIGLVKWSVQYRPFDLVPRHPSVTAFDITTETLPACDLILCRAVLNHLDSTRVDMAVERFREAGKYLLATQFSGVTKDATEFCRLDLRERLGAPLESIPDTCGERSELALWKL